MFNSPVIEFKPTPPQCRSHSTRVQCHLQRGQGYSLHFVVPLPAHCMYNSAIQQTQPDNHGYNTGHFCQLQQSLQKDCAFFGLTLPALRFCFVSVLMIPVAERILNIAVMPAVLIARDTLLTMKRHLSEIFILNTNTSVRQYSGEESMIDSRQNSERYDRMILFDVGGKITLSRFGSSSLCKICLISICLSLKTKYIQKPGTRR